MRVITAVIISMFAAGVAFPATAAPTWEQCNQEALKHGLTPQQKGQAEFIKECQAARTTVVARERPGLSFDACEARALALGMPHGQTGHVEYVRECMGERPRGR